jgi:hypothetical protein
MSDQNPVEKSRRGDRASHDPVKSGSGAATGKPSPPPTTPPDAAQPPEEVTTIPLGIPDSKNSFRDLKERARRPSSTNDPAHVDPEQEQ